MSIISHRLIAIRGIAIALGGCQSIDQSIADMDRANFQRACDNLGIERGTPSYDECMLQQQRLDDENTQNIVERVHEDEMVKKLRK